MNASNAYHIREHIKAFKHDADCFGLCARIAIARRLPNAYRIADVNRAAAARIAEWAFTYDAMLRGEYGEV